MRDLVRAGDDKIRRRRAAGRLSREEVGGISSPRPTHPFLISHAKNKEGNDK